MVHVSVPSGDEVLPCGCIFRCSIVDGVKTGTYIPCKQTCVNYQNMLKMSAEKSMTIKMEEGHVTVVTIRVDEPV